MVELSAVGDYCDAIFCICLMNVFENKFSDLISQIQQSSIVIASLRSTQTCGGRSSAVQVRMKVVVVGGSGWCVWSTSEERVSEH